MKPQLLVIFLFISALSNAQSNTTKSAVMRPIMALFTGMNLGDSATVHSAFVKDPNMGSIAKDKSGNAVLRKSELANFLNAVGTPHAEPWSEPIWDAKIEIDGDFAQVWVKYAFYLGNKFSHCGVDAFHLIKDGTGWKIFHLVDTRQTVDCEVPPTISNKFK